MPSRPDPAAMSALVERLRAAGCVFAEDEATLLISSAETPAELESMLQRRVEGLPLEHILGWAEFCGRRILVEAGVFVPRRRTEFLVSQALARLDRRADPRRPADRPLVLVDLCCGSGAVGVALADALGAVELHAVDIDPAAVRCARRNVTPLAGAGTARGYVYEGDLYAVLPGSLRGRVDGLIANAPYVPTAAISTMPPEAREHEPPLALDGGADGLDVLRRVLAGAASWLRPGGHVLVETSVAQGPRLIETAVAPGLAFEVARDEEIGATVVIGIRPN
jgi:release factor glutamine methyltransferase